MIRRFKLGDIHTTGSYHMKCMTFPVVEGRLFMRGFDGIHCYDLRKKD